ncbi:MAG: type II secretion system protein [Lachnospiraceae bacterium]|nr:type II secretion system protein [Lachnospiraceae bacterium]
MKKSKKMNNKGFTLVELIVVLVILAILAAILVPTLLGYIERAREEKDFSTAQAVRVAVQSEIAELYGKGKDPVEWSDVEGAKEKIFKLIGADSDGNLDGQTIALSGGTINSSNQLTYIKLTIGGKTYAYTTEGNKWVAGDEASSIAAPTGAATPTTTP